MFSATFFGILEGKCTTAFKKPVYHPASIANSTCLLSHCNAQAFEDLVFVFGGLSIWFVYFNGQRLFTGSRLCSKLQDLNEL